MATMSTGVGGCVCVFICHKIIALVSCLLFFYLHMCMYIHTAIHM